MNERAFRKAIRGIVIVLLAIVSIAALITGMHGIILGLVWLGKVTHPIIALSALASILAICIGALVYLIELHDDDDDNDDGPFKLGPCVY